jgi:hypothetical protein
VNLYTEEHTRLLKSLLKYHVKFILVGGYAAIYYGVNRNTGDLDILIEPTAENGKLLIAALKDDGLEVPEILPEEFEREMVLSFGLEPEGVDILNFTPGIEFRSAYENSIEETFSGLKIRIIHIRDLIRNKEQLQRKGEKSFLDKYDVEVLKKIQKRKEEK